MASLLRELNGRLSPSDPEHSVTSEAEVEKLNELVLEIAKKICPVRDQQDLSSNGDTFVAFDGHVLLIKLMESQVTEVDEGGLKLASGTSTMLNEIIRIMTELVATMDHHAKTVSQHPRTLPLLFTLMGQKESIHRALTLALKLLSAIDDCFPLSDVNGFSHIISSLSPHNLAIVCRALAVLLSKPLEQSMEGLPPPECVPPNLCTKCKNNQLLVLLPDLLPRIVHLLSMPSPPNSLFRKTLLLELVSSGLAMPLAQWNVYGDDREDSWEVATSSVAGPAAREMPVLFPMNERSDTTLADLGVPCQEITNAGNFQIVQLSVLERSLWANLQADQLYVLLRSPPLLSRSSHAPLTLLPALTFLSPPSSHPPPRLLPSTLLLS
jgi:hypothetical protein